jgi:hypothetical protein
MCRTLRTNIQAKVRKQMQLQLYHASDSQTQECAPLIVVGGFGVCVCVCVCACA